MYGDLGTKLVQHAKRTQSLPSLPPYQTDLIQQIIREVRALDTAVSNLLQPFQGSFDPSAEPAVACALLVNHLAMRRNKRCLLAYHRVRTGRMEEAVWSGRDPLDSSPSVGNGGIGEGGAAGGSAEGGSSVSNLSPEEEEYARGYAELLAAYKGKWTDVDLTGSLEPPRELFVDVRVLKDAGEIQTEYGAITLTKNSQFFVRQGDVERLIAQGYLQKLD